MVANKRFQQLWHCLILIVQVLVQSNNRHSLPNMFAICVYNFDHTLQVIASYFQ